MMKQRLNTIQKKFAGFFAVVLVTVAMSASLVYASEQGHVYDDGELLSDTEISELATLVESLEEKTGWEIFAVSTTDAGGKSAMAYADDFFDTHTDVDADGVVVLIDMDNREIYVSTCGEAIRYLTDDRIENVLDEGFAYVGDGEYAACYTAMLSKISYYYGYGIPSNQYNYDTETGAISRYRSLTFTEIGMALIVAILAGGGFGFFIKAKYQMKLNLDKYDYHKNGTVALSHSEDRFINETHTKHRIQSSSSGSGGSSGRSSTHHSSGGRSHGGGGRKF